MQGKDVVLGLLNEKEMSGYEIKEVLDTQLAFFFDGTFGMIYPLLRKLEKEKLIEKKHIIQDGKPNKNVYSITPDGKEAFQSYINSELSEESFKSDFLMRLYFGENLTKEQLVSFTQQELERKEHNLQLLQKNFQQWEANGISDTQKITIDYGTAYYRAEIEVLKNALENLS